MDSDLIVFRNKIYSVYFEAETNIIVVKAKGVPNQDVLTEAWWKALEIAEQNQTRKWVADDAELQIIHPQATKWWIEEWLPEAHNRLTFKGKRYTAAVLPSKFYAEMSSRSANQALEESFNSKYYEQQTFRELAQALTWLRSVE